MSLELDALDRLEHADAALDGHLLADDVAHTEQSRLRPRVGTLDDDRSRRHAGLCPPVFDTPDHRQQFTVKHGCTVKCMRDAGISPVSKE